MEITAKDGKMYNTEVYRLDAIIAVWYRINSKNMDSKNFKRIYDQRFWFKWWTVYKWK